MTNYESQDPLVPTPGADRAQVEANYSAQRSRIRSKLERAPTEALRLDYRDQLARLEDEYEQALAKVGGSATDLTEAELRDLPASKPRFGRSSGSGSRSGARSGTLAQGGGEIPEGTILLDRYEILRCIGGGGMGVVYAAFDTNRDEEIAVKLMRPELAEDDKLRERFITEARLSSSLSHPRIVNVFDVIIDGDRAYLTMELLQGRSLRQELEERRLTSQSFTVEEVRAYAMELCEALSHAHAVTVHRDVKPENVWVDEQGRLKLMDFGIAQLPVGSDGTDGDGALGTACYMAPEQIRGEEAVDARTDQYALAILLYELLTFELPVGRSVSVWSTRRDVPRSFSNALERALSRRPSDRFPTTDAFADALRAGKVPSARRLAVPAVALLMLGGAAIALPGPRGMIQDWWAAVPVGDGADVVVTDVVPEEVRELRDRWNAIVAEPTANASVDDARAAELQIRQGREALDRDEDDVARESFAAALATYEGLIDDHERRVASRAAGADVLAEVDEAIDRASRAKEAAGIEGGTSGVARSGAKAAFDRGDTKEGQRKALEAVNAAEQERIGALRARAATAIATARRHMDGRRATRTRLEQEVSQLKQAASSSDRERESAATFSELLALDRRVAEDNVAGRRAMAELAMLEALMDSAEWTAATTPVDALARSLEGDSTMLSETLCDEAEAASAVLAQLTPDEISPIDSAPDESIEGVVEIGGELIAYRRVTSALMRNSAAKNECWYHVQGMLRAELDRRGLSHLKTSKRNTANPPSVAGPSSLAWRVTLP